MFYDKSGLNLKANFADDENLFEKINTFKIFINIIIQYFREEKGISNTTY